MRLLGPPCCVRAVDVSGTANGTSGGAGNAPGTSWCSGVSGRGGASAWGVETTGGVCVRASACVGESARDAGSERVCVGGAANGGAGGAASSGERAGSGAGSRAGSGSESLRMGAAGSGAAERACSAGSGSADVASACGAAGTLRSSAGTRRSSGRRAGSSLARASWRTGLAARGMGGTGAALSSTASTPPADAALCTALGTPARYAANTGSGRPGGVVLASARQLSSTDALRPSRTSVSAPRPRASTGPRPPGKLGDGRRIAFSSPFCAILARGPSSVGVSARSAGAGSMRGAVWGTRGSARPPPRGAGGAAGGSGLDARMSSSTVSLALCDSRARGTMRTRLASAARARIARMSSGSTSSPESDSRSLSAAWSSGTLPCGSGSRSAAICAAWFSPRAPRGGRGPRSGLGDKGSRIRERRHGGGK